MKPSTLDKTAARLALLAAIGEDRVRYSVWGDLSYHYELSDEPQGRRAWYVLTALSAAGLIEHERGQGARYGKKVYLTKLGAETLRRWRDG